MADSESDVPREISSARLFEETPQTETNSGDLDEKKACPTSCCGYRWLTVVLISFGMIVIHAQRVNVAVSLLAVYDNLEDKVGNHAARKNLPLSTVWSALKISLLHSGFFIGYLVTQMPAGILSYHFRAQRVFGYSIVLSCLMNMILPTLIDKDIYWATMLVRIGQGLAEGFIWPAAFVLTNNWSTKKDVNKLAGFVATGSYTGAIIGFPLCGLVTHYVGWQYIYYISGVSGILWWIFWLVLVYEKPDHHPKISEHELYLLTKDKPQSFQYTSWRDLPWKRIATSAPFASVCACAFAKGWVFNLLLMQEPTYMHVFGYNIAENGILSALPFFSKIIVCYVAGIVADVLVNQTFLNKTQVRKMFNTLGFGIEALCLFSLSFIYDGTAALALLSVGVSMGGLAISGWQINHLDLAPQLAGILVAISQCFSNLAGILSPLAAGSFIQQSGELAEAIGQSGIKVDNVDIYGWHMVFLLSSLIILICAVFYIIFASGEEQDWAKLIPSSNSNCPTSTMSQAVLTSVSYQTLQQSASIQDQRHHIQPSDNEGMDRSIDAETIANNNVDSQ